MLLEFLSDGAPECPLIRLYEFTPFEARQLRAAVADLASGRAEKIPVHELPGVVAVGRCELFLCLRDWDQAVVQLGPLTFECGFTAGTWDNVAGLIEPFQAESGGYQWLAGVPGEAGILLSTTGPW